MEQLQTGKPLALTLACAILALSLVSVSAAGAPTTIVLSNDAKGAVAEGMAEGMAEVFP